MTLLPKYIHAQYIQVVMEVLKARPLEPHDVDTETVNIAERRRKIEASKSPTPTSHTENIHLFPQRKEKEITSLAAQY